MPVILATQEDRDLKPAGANSSWDPISKKPITKKKRAGEVTQSLGPKLKSQYRKKNFMNLKLFSTVSVEIYSFTNM
jgi:hypothetical protein